ncbi:MAG: type II secretion system secretin GspD [Steroidobacteraceae bacterium]|nr:type II secretion system secretin GspD [Steroidobacteraceae bacterium]
MMSKVLQFRRWIGMRQLVVIVLCAFAATSLVSAQPGQRITPNFKDAEIGQVIEAVAAATGKTIIPDPRVRAQVTMLSSTAMSPSAFYEAFLALLSVHQFIAVETGGIVRILPDANARQMPSNDLPGRVSSTSDELVTQIVSVQNVSAAQLVPVLRPLMPQAAHLAAYPASNILIISDRANNVNRLMRIVQRIDRVGDTDVDVVNLQNASSGEVVRIVNSFFQQQAAAEGGGATVRVIADERSNSLLIGGDQSQRLKVKALIAHLDTPLDSGGDTQVRYLRYADAEKLATRLKEQVGATIAIAGGPGAAGAAGAAPSAPTGITSDRSVTIWAEPETNALVVTAPRKIMQSLMAVVDKIDIRRAQVLVEALIVELNDTNGASLGVSWVIDGINENKAVGGFLPSGASSPVVNLAAIAQDPSATNLANAPSGFSVGIGRLANTGINFAAVVNAIRSNAKNNVIATPSTVTLDNQEAELKVAREVPFLTGQFTNTGAATGSVNPFQTVQRQEVGLILKVTPQISDENVLLKIELESSQLEGATAGGVANLNQITSKRSIKTSVLIDDGGTVVLGGLLSDSLTSSESRVPFLGRIPIVGELFRDRSGTKEKRNLMLFLRPRILHDGIDAQIETNTKYNYMREEQRKQGRGEYFPLLPGAKKPMLPPVPPPPAKSATPKDIADDAATNKTEAAPAAAEPANDEPPTP